MTANRGYTLVELVLVILIFSIVMLLISSSFNRILASSSVLAKAAETDIGGLIGLEVLRSDLELAGFGLPWQLPANFTYSEAGCPGDCNEYHDADSPDKVPRPVVVGDNKGFNGSDYLVLKGTALGMSTTSRRWAYLNYSSTGTVIKQSGAGSELLLGSGERALVIKQSGTSDGKVSRKLVTVAGGSSFTLVFSTPLAESFLPSAATDNFLVYGVAPPDKDPLEFPFNRADYYLNRTDDIPSYCAGVDRNRGTGVLYKKVISHNSTTHFAYPLLDCVADLQVVFFLDTGGTGAGDYHTGSELFVKGVYSAGDLRDQIKEIRIYILAQQGRKDLSYLYPVVDPERAIVVGDRGLAPELSGVWSAARLSSQISPDWRHYHWKLFSIVVQPGNL
ncbi:type IV pilus minor pilin PilW [Geomonas silvestris]|uniref:Type IV pilus minor pilin PilW n=1 Tax=Geomonas silvestris TaxID=2740184 RepID=A0A6V8MDF7_9BACT|nr:type II secretion system protein [Geomonas silvestris]GFO58045.1 type IV pilus minor pilin PilW [Geomonas silvestris]